MPILGSILKKAINIKSNFPKIGKRDAYVLQEKVLRGLLERAEFTAFGEYYKFSKMLNRKELVESFKEQVPIHDYNTIFQKWWFRVLNGEPYVCWPEQVKYFALSSGTSEASSKHIPVTQSMLKAIKKTSIRQIISMANYDLPKDHFERGILMIGGSTHLNFNGTYFEGDLSGITTGNIPFWFQHFYKPGKRISKERDWNSKLDEIVRNADKWDIGIVCGVPAWIQILFERVIDHYNVKTIHDIWPNLLIYVHGGVSFSPYKRGFERLLSKPLLYLDTYLASEGFVAYQDRPGAEGMKMVLDNGIFYEFVPFNDDNFDFDGNIKPDADTLTLKEVEVNKEYAILLSTCSGAWRYLIGDTIKFTSLEHMELLITGRTKHFLSLCGEHLSQDNMNRAVAMLSDQLNIQIKEFTVAGIPYDSLFAHRWYIGTNDPVDKVQLKEQLDENLKLLNDDYRVERIAALKEVFIEVLPEEVFYEWMKRMGKEGGQSKFPRVLKGDRLKSWTAFLEEKQLNG